MARTCTYISLPTSLPSVHGLHASLLRKTLFSINESSREQISVLTASQGHIPQRKGGPRSFPSRYWKLMNTSERRCVRLGPFSGLHNGGHCQWRYQRVEGGSSSSISVVQNPRPLWSKRILPLPGQRAVREGVNFLGYENTDFIWGLPFRARRCSESWLVTL